MRLESTLLLSFTILLAPIGCDPKEPTDDEVTDPGGSTTGGDDPGSDDAGEGPGNDGPHGWGCIESSTVIDASAQTALGFSAEDMLDGKLGTRQSELRFATEPTFLASEIAGKILPLEVTLAWQDGEIRFIESEPDPDHDWGDNLGGFGPECHDRIEVDVVFSFVTAGGELDEQRQTTLVARSVDRAHIARGSVTGEGTDLYPPALQGSLDPDAIFDDPDVTLRVLVAMATWHDDLAGGSLGTEIQGGPDHGDGGWIGFGPIASWGDEIPFVDEF
jgi:hypothetical protein